MPRSLLHPSAGEPPEAPIGRVLALLLGWLALLVVILGAMCGCATTGTGRETLPVQGHLAAAQASGTAALMDAKTIRALNGRAREDSGRIGAGLLSAHADADAIDHKAVRAAELIRGWRLRHPQPARL